MHFIVCPRREKYAIIHYLVLKKFKLVPANQTKSLTILKALYKIIMFQTVL